MTSPSDLELLWQRTRASFARAIAAIGTPAAIAALAVLTKGLRRAIVGRVLRLEHLVRKLLLAEAAELHLAELARAERRVKIEHIPLRGMAHHWRGELPCAKNSIAETRTPKGRRAIDFTQPETWPVQFSFALPRNTRIVTNARAPRVRALWGPYVPPPPAPPRVKRMAQESPSLRLARRLEALRRVLENPKPHAERLARVLAREVRRMPDLIVRYAFAPVRTNDRDEIDYRLGVDIYAPCVAVAEAFDSS